MTQPNPLDPGYWLTEDLRGFGFAEVGRNVRISRQCNIVGLANIRIGSNVRIDFATTIIAGAPGVRIGSYVHIGAYCYLAGGNGIELCDFTGLSQRVSLYTSSDDYSGGAFTNPTVPAELTNVRKGPVTVGRHAILGSGAIVLPGVTLAEGTSVGALSLVTRATDPWTIQAGVPARPVRARTPIDPDGTIAARLLEE